MSKEWKGNKKSVSTMLGMSTTWHPEQRAAGDYYTTDPTAVRQFLDTLNYKLTNGVVWECACGCGNISEVLKEYGHKVISTDLHDRGYGWNSIDFLQSKLIDDKCDIIFTNPPYSLANEFILHGLDILPDGGEYYALMNISYLSGIKRFQEIYSKGYLYAVYIYSHRIHCYKNNQNLGHSSPVNYAWFRFIKGVTSRSPRIYWIEK